MFRKEARITTRTSVGTSGVVNIDREAKLSGPIYNKGAMILSGYLGQKYATEMPLAISASIAFEQLYEGIEGDSAASAELLTGKERRMTEGLLCRTAETCPGLPGPVLKRSYPR